MQYQRLKIPLIETGFLGIKTVAAFSLPLTVHCSWRTLKNPILWLTKIWSSFPIDSILKKKKKKKKKKKEFLILELNFLQGNYFEFNLKGSNICVGMCAFDVTLTSRRMRLSISGQIEWSRLPEAASPKSQSIDIDLSDGHRVSFSKIDKQVVIEKYVVSNSFLITIWELKRKYLRKNVLS